MSLKNHDISLREVFCFVPISAEARYLLEPYRKTKKILSVGSYYRYRKKLRINGESYIDEIDSRINEFKELLPSNFGIKYVSEAITLIIFSMNIYESRFLTSYFGLNINEPLERSSSVFVKALNTKNKLLDKIRRPVYLDVIERVLECNKREIFNLFSGDKKHINDDTLYESIKKINGEHRLAIELYYVYYEKFLNKMYFKSESDWFYRDENKLERVIASIMRN